MQFADAAPPPLPKFVQNYLRLADLDYELPRGQFEPFTLSYLEQNGELEPWAVNSDFNGDGVIDWAGLLRDTEGGLDLVVVYSFRKYYSHEVLTSPESDSDEILAGVYSEPPGKVLRYSIFRKMSKPEITLRNPGIHLVWSEKDGVLFYWNGSGFNDFLAGD